MGLWLGEDVTASFQAGYWLQSTPTAAIASSLDKAT